MRNELLPQADLLSQLRVTRQRIAGIRTATAAQTGEDISLPSRLGHIFAEQQNQRTSQMQEELLKQRLAKRHVDRVTAWLQYLAEKSKGTGDEAEYARHRLEQLEGDDTFWGKLERQSTRAGMRDKVLDLHERVHESVDSNRARSLEDLQLVQEEEHKESQGPAL